MPAMFRGDDTKQLWAYEPENMNKLQFNIVVLLPALFSLVVACAPESAPATAPAAKKPAQAIPSKQATEIEWQNLIAAAQKEGKVVVMALGAASNARDALAKAVKDEFGISVDFIAVRGSEAGERLRRERGAGIFGFDVYLGSGTTSTAVLKPQGMLDQLDGVLILPQVTDEKSWRGYYGLFYDKAHMLAGGWGSPNPPIRFNTELVKREEMRSFKDLLNPKWKGRIMISDPTISGSGHSGMSTIMALMGEDFIRKLVEQKPILLRDLRQQLEWLARGKYAILLGGSSMSEFADLPSIAAITPVEGGYMTPGVGIVALFNRAFHPNAAKLLINWMLTKEGQGILGPPMDAASRRVDVDNSWVPSERRPQPGVNYLYEDEESQLGFPERAKLFRELFKPVM